MANDLPELLTPRELAEYLSVSEKKLAYDRGRGIGPRYVIVGSRSIRYPVDAVAEWLEHQTRQSTSDPGPRK